jgi:hypothetical protein
MANQRQIANFDKRIRQISKNSNRVSPEDEIKTHDDTSGDADDSRPNGPGG